MIELLRLLIEICRRRLGPQDLPHSPALLRGLLLTVIGLQVLLALMLDEAIDSPGRLLFSVLLMLALPWLLLHWRGRRERYVQTMSALLGTDVLFLLLIGPLLWFAGDMPPPSETVAPAPAQVFVSLFGLALMGWKIAIDGHIWRHALDWPVVAGVLLALGLFVFDVGLDQMLFADPAP